MSLVTIKHKSQERIGSFLHTASARGGAESEVPL
jgi:hypothetical protein